MDSQTRVLGDSEDMGAFALEPEKMKMLLRMHPYGSYSSFSLKHSLCHVGWLLLQV
jgi:hypothetical protein